MRLESSFGALWELSMYDASAVSVCQHLETHTSSTFFVTDLHGKDRVDPTDHFPFLEQIRWRWLEQWPFKITNRLFAECAIYSFFSTIIDKKHFSS